MIDPSMRECVRAMAHTIRRSISLSISPPCKAPFVRPDARITRLKLAPQLKKRTFLAPSNPPKPSPMRLQKAGSRSWASTPVIL